jgi:hypothetical protein
MLLFISDTNVPVAVIVIPLFFLISCMDRDKKPAAPEQPKQPEPSLEAQLDSQVKVFYRWLGYIICIALACLINVTGADIVNALL